MDSDPVPVALHAVRIVEPWDSESVTWARQPRVADVGAPLTRVRPASGPLVRIDVRDIVSRWRRRERDEFGVMVLSDDKSPSGMPFALRPLPARADPFLEGSTPALTGPVLELYVK
jgi:hypothetical protein